MGWEEDVGSYAKDVQEATGAVKAAKDKYATTKAVGGVAAGVAMVPGPGTVIAGVMTAAAAVYDTVTGMFKGLSPSDSWEDTNKIADPTARKLTEKVIYGVGEGKVSIVFNSYVQKLKGYIRSSPHNNTQTENFLRAIDTEAIGMGGGFKFDGFPFPRPEQVQLAWAIWLHAHWLYGGVSHDEIVNKTAYKKFNDSLIPTLVAAVQETTGERFIQAGETVVDGSGGIKTGAGGISSLMVNASNFFSSPVAAIAIAGVLVFALVKWGGRR